ncbi:SDR family oxidoreductase [Leifsonia shinshuensis]|uniref:SDR family NAD(P)-dependent oxidoreductase n=1 Tax=Leifsonia shinshuensis TaxID=150026 RepID=UPI001F5071BB|nr:SDR family oxidoreductase [Leifsonia shinshuensis]MCI0158757.1 SDR family oxidoreductase [Leifsonia shinshuensis]
MVNGSCVVTGAASGIGAAIAAELAERGWAVVGLDLHPGDGGTEIVIGDVADPAAHRSAADRAAERAPLRGWVNCAGYNILGSVVELAHADLVRGIEVDLLGVFHGTAEAMRRFLTLAAADRDAAVVNISSIQAAVGFPGFAAYAMAKGGIEALTRQVAAEYVTEGVRVNAVAPGLVESPMNEAILDPEREERWRHITPMGRWAKPREVAKAVAFLLSADASYITGEVLAVNGGALALAPGQGSRRG